MKFYDRQRKCIVFINEVADSDFWDNHWLKNKGSKSTKFSRKNFTIKNTLPYLKPHDGPILEGGCGNGNNVNILHAFNYDVIGLDYAEKTIKNLKITFPNLNFEYGDVRSLPYNGNYFAGYWSVGVIEHFWNGYDAIASEMARVIKPGGYLFITFPQMSILRKFKAVINLYPIKHLEGEPPNFYQFALDSGSVVKDFNTRGFNVVKIKPYSAIKGLKDEIAILKKPLQYLFDNKTGNLFVKIMQKSIEILFSRFAGHSILIVLRKI
jgi:SAM-dependent methyltransferase